MELEAAEAQAARELAELKRFDDTLRQKNVALEEASLADNEFPAFLEISITDSGIGIARDGLERLFQPFSQIDSGLARKFEGAGLGLAIVKRLAELHGGTVAVESAVGEGSCFTVWLPLRASEELALTSAGAPATPHIEALAGE